MKRGCKSDRERPDCERAKGIAALAGVAIVFLAGRRCSSSSTTAAIKETAPTPAPPERTELGEFFHWFTWPIRKEDQAKRRLEENPPKAPEPPKGTGRKLSVCCVTLTCGETTDAKPDDGEKPEKKDEAPNSLMSIVLKILGAIATGIGVVGAVTVVGAAVFWVRFDAIGLPATQAVSVVPKAELLVQGAQEVTLFIAIGLSAALLIAFADPKGVVTRGTFIVLCLFVVGAVTYAAAKGLDFDLVLILGAFALVLALLSVGIAFNTEERLLPLLVSVFLASLIFSSGCALLVVHDQKFAQAIAIRFGADEKGAGKGLNGIYVTATSDTIYYGQTGADPELEGVDTTGLYEVHRTDTTTFAIGPLGPTDGPGEADLVKKQGENLLKRLNRDGKSFVRAEAGKGKTGGESGETGKAAKEAAK